MSPLSHRDMSRAKSAAVPAQSEGANVGQAVNEAMRAIEKENPDLADVLPKSYHSRRAPAISRCWFIL